MAGRPDPGQQRMALQGLFRKGGGEASKPRPPQPPIAAPGPGVVSPPIPPPSPMARLATRLPGGGDGGATWEALAAFEPTQLPRLSMRHRALELLQVPLANVVSSG